MLIRPLTPADAAAYTSLRCEMLADAPWAFAASPENDVGLNATHIAQKLSEPGYAIIGAFDDQGRLIGAAALILNHHRKMAHRAHIWGVYVSPTARKQGVGHAIMQRTMDTARTWPGVTSVGLSASVHSPAAVALYKRLGFVPWGIEPGCMILSDGTTYDEIHMVAPLKP